MLSRTIPTDSSCYNDSEKSIVWPIYDHDDVPFRSYWRKGQMLNFWVYRGQTGKNDPILLAMVSKCLSSKYNENHMWDASLLWLRNKNGQPMDTNFLTA